MTTTASPSRSVAPTAGWRGYAAGALVLVVKLLSRQRNRRAVRRLAELDDHLLADLGLYRADIEVSLRMPSAGDPSQQLAMLSAGRALEPERRVRGRRGA